MSRGARRSRAACAARVALVALAAASTAAAPQPGLRWTIDPATAQVGFDLRAFAHTVHGATAAVSGEVRSVDGPPTGSLRLAGRIVVDPATLDTGNDKRDRKMREKSLDVDRHPTIEFVPASLEPAAQDCREGADSAVDCRDLVGDLTIRGVTRPVRIAVELRELGERWLVDGSVELTWSEFGVPDPSFLFVRVKPTVRVGFHVELLPSRS